MIYLFIFVYLLSSFFFTWPDYVKYRTTDRQADNTTISSVVNQRTKILASRKTNNKNKPKNQINKLKTRESKLNQRNNSKKKNLKENP